MGGTIKVTTRTFDDRKPRGGKRRGSGRKASPKTILARLALAELEEEAEKSIAFLVHVRNDAQYPIGVRVECARDLIDRRFGKPKQGSEIPNDNVPMVIQIVPAPGFSNGTSA
jgi:hypothetical protein